MRVQVVGGSNTVYYLQTDHLGSTTALSSLAVGGGLVSGSTARYLPFGGWRTTPTQTLTDRGYTGHLENMEIGLVYMNARYYVPAIGRFASADTIVPNPAEPQSFNRYAYTLNNPLRYTDPTGHCAQDDNACWELAEEMYRLYGWRIDGIWTIDQIRLFLQAGQAITDWFARNGGGDAIGRMRAVFGGAHFAHGDLISVFLNTHHVRDYTVFLLDNFNLSTIVHELGHVLDNRLGLGFGFPIGSALFGGVLQTTCLVSLEPSRQHVRIGLDALDMKPQTNNRFQLHMLVAVPQRILPSRLCFQS